MLKRILEIVAIGTFLAVTSLPAQTGCPGTPHTPGTITFNSAFPWNYFHKTGTFWSPADAPWVVGAGAYCNAPANFNNGLGYNEMAVTTGAGITCGGGFYYLSQDGGTLPGEYTLFTHGTWVQRFGFSTEEEWCYLTTCNAQGATILNYDHYGSC